MKKWKYLILFFICTITNGIINAQFAIQGLVHVQEEAMVHVWNDVEITTADGLLENSGTIEVEGNWLKTSAGQFNGNPSGDGTRLVIFRNNDFNTTGSQRISGMMTISDAFYNLSIDNTGAERLVDLSGDIEISNNLNFVNGRIRTDVISSLAGDGNAYPFSVLVSSPDNNAITGQTLISDVDRYVEGRLLRTVEGMGTFSFPVGVAPNLLDGAEPFVVTFTSPAMRSNISAAFQIGSTSMEGETRFCDLGVAPNFEIPDGVLDQLTVDCVAGQWLTEGDGSNYNFDIQFLPGPNFLNTCSDAVLFYTALDGAFEDCPDLSGNMGINGTGLTAFSIFDIPTVSEISITTSLEIVDENDARIKIYPNPISSQETLFIDIEGTVFNGENITLEIYDAIGRMVLQDDHLVTQGQQEINLGGLRNGVFHVVLKNANVVANRKIILQE